MKNALSLIFLFLAIGCKSQSPELPIYNNHEFGDVHEAYYKDVNNELNPFEGTWEFDNSGTVFRIVLQKKMQFYNAFSHIYEDLLIGEYYYKENNVEKVNTLSLITSPPSDLYKHNIVGNFILGKYTRPQCSDCSESERRISLSFSDPTRIVKGLNGEIELRRMDEGNVQKIKLILTKTGNIIITNGITPEYSSFNVSFGEYLLTKQP
ncbi:MAG TPA: DUF6705 family protein [Flavobacterium sp.]|nr:DUF6705 family protein [Flavobacterium sp.]